MSDFRRDMPAWGISLLFNGAILLSCHFIAWTVATTSPSTDVVSVIDEVTEADSVYDDAMVTDQKGAEGATLSMSPPDDFLYNYMNTKYFFNIYYLSNQ